MTTQDLWRAIHVYPRLRGVKGFGRVLRIVRRELPKLVREDACACRSHLAAYVKANPPDVSSPDALFAWGVALHNDVNARIGKPLISLDDARKRWQP